MKRRKTHINVVFVLTGLLLVSLVLSNGCKKKTESSLPAETKEAVSAITEQTVCPVMAGAINKELFTEYKGKKVYFCCLGCKEAFEKEPEKYLDKLPQFRN